MATLRFTPSHPSAPWRVYHRGKSFWFTTEAEAQAKLVECAGTLRPFSARELDEYRHAKEILQGAPLVAAVRHYMEHQSGETETTVAEAIARQTAAATGRPDYLEKRAYYLGKLSAAIGSKQLRAVTPDDVERAMQSVNTDWGKNTFFAHVRVLFRYCVRMRLTRNNPCEGMTERKVEASKVILSLADAKHLMATCEQHAPDIAPAMALQMFAGIRTSEVCRLPWSAVRIGEHIDIAPNVAKTHERRVIDWWTPALARYVKETGQGGVVDRPKSYEARKHQVCVIAKETKPDFTWGQNAARHSFASYAVAYWQNAGRVALLMGQRDVNVLFRHYRSYRSEAEGAAYFGLRVRKT